MKILYLLLLLCLHFFTFAQTQFENPGFEEWEDIQYGSVPEPVEWSSIRSGAPDELAQVAPAIWDRSDDARTGSHSLYLINKAAFGIVATGMVTNGRVLVSLNYDEANSHTEPDFPQWHTAISHRPDSVVGWYKANPKPGDFPTAKVLMHVGYASLPQQDSTTWIGVAYAELSGSPVNTWTRFSAPFEYFDNRTPEFMLTILTAGNGTNAIDGSEVWFDDLELIYNDGTSIAELTQDQLNVSSVDGILSVQLSGPGNSKGILKVYDLAGRELYNTEIVTGDKREIKLPGRQGIYLVTLNTGSTVLSRKVFVN